MPYDEKNNPNNNRLPEQNTFGRTSELKVGDKVWKIFGDMRHSFTYGTVERTEGMSGRVYVRWQSGVAYQEDPLYLLKREDFPYHTAMKSAAQRLAVRDLLSKKPKNHKDGCKCVFCERGGSKEEKKEDSDEDSSGVEASITNTDRRELISSDANLYGWWKSSKLSMAAFVRENKEKIDSVILRDYARTSACKCGFEKGGCKCAKGCDCGCNPKEKTSHASTCSCPVCHSKTTKNGKVMVCTKEGCFFVRQD
jgi:hypothetical protein